MVWITPRKVIVEGVAPPEYTTVERTEPEKVAVIEDTMPTDTEMKITIENVRILEIYLERYLLTRGLSAGEVNSYVTRMSMYGREFRMTLDVKPPFFMILHYPKPWRIRGVMVDGKVPMGLVIDPVEALIFIPLVESSSPVEVTIELEPIAQANINAMVSAVVAVLAVMVFKPFLKSIIRAATRAIRR